MKSSTIIKSKSPKPYISSIVSKKNYLNKNFTKKYIYKKEKATDTDKVLQNNKISKNIVFSPVYNKNKNGIKTKNVLNNSNCDIRRALEIRDDVNIDYDQYQQNSFFLNSPTIGNYNPITNNSVMNQSYYIMNKKNSFLSSNRNNNKWKCGQCGNVNSNFNYLCNNCNMPKNTVDQNSSIIVNQRNNSTGKNLESIGLDNNIINSSFNNNSFNNNSFNNNSINNTSHNLLSKSINNSIMKKQILKKNNNSNNNLKTLTSNISNYSTNNLLNPYYSNVGYNTIRNKNNNNNNYFYSGANVNINQNNSISSNNIFDTERDTNITHLYSYTNFLANELKSSNDTNIKLLESYQNNESEYNNNYQQNDSIKKKIKILKEKENQLDKINEQLQKSLQYIKEKYDDKNMDDQEGNNYLNNCIIKSLFEEQNIDEIKSKIKEFTEENEKLSDKLKENKDIIIKLKTRIGELSDDKKSNKNIDININNNNKKNQKIIIIRDLKEKLGKNIEEVKEQNLKYNTLNNENKNLEQKIKLLQKQIGDEENNNNLNENKKFKQTNQVSINNDSEKEKDKYMKIKEKNNQLVEFFDELNKFKNNKGFGSKIKNRNELNKLKEIYINLDKKNLIEDEEDNDEKEMIEFIDEYMNLLNEGID